MVTAPKIKPPMTSNETSFQPKANGPLRTRLMMSMVKATRLMATST
jgi:hypothetical protein